MSPDALKSEAEVESPDWHKEALAKTEARLRAGKEQVLDWEEAKRKIRNR